MSRAWQDSMWPLVPIRRFARKVVRPVPADSEVVTAFRDGFVGPRSLRREEGFTFSDLEQGYQGVHRGDLVFHGLDGFAGAFGVAVEGGRCSPVCHVITFTDDDPRYVTYALRVAAGSGLLEVQVPSTRQRAVDFRNWSTFASMALPRPPLEDQRRIADFLDREIDVVDHAVAVRQRQADLLSERLRAAVAHAVVGGSAVDRPVPARTALDLQDPFVKELPSDWRTMRFANVAWRASRRAPQEVPLLSVYLGRGVILSAEAKGYRHAASLDVSNYQYVMPGDLVFNNQQAWRGSLGVATVHGIISPAYMIYALSDALLPDYAHYLFRSPAMVFQYGQVSQGVGTIQRNLDAEGLRRVVVPVPPRDSQRRIADLCRRLDSEAGAAADVLRRQLDLLAERKQSLLHGAVTGQINLTASAVVA